MVDMPKTKPIMQKFYKWNTHTHTHTYTPPAGWRVSTLAKEFSAAARIMQSSSKEVSTLVADKNVNKRTLLLLLLHNTLKIPLANVVRLFPEQSEIKTNVKLDGFRSRLRTSYVSSHTEEFW